MAMNFAKNKIVIRKLIPTNIGPPNPRGPNHSTEQDAAQQRDTEIIAPPGRFMPGMTAGQDWYFRLNMFGLLPINLLTGMFFVPVLTGQKASLMGLENIFTFGLWKGFEHADGTAYRFGMGRLPFTDILIIH